jgi:hypothetical protein
VRIISLTKGYVAIVDDEDYEKLSRYKWFATTHRSSRTVYAMRHDRDMDGRRILIHMHKAALGVGSLTVE